jgi:hypothetical protein
VNEGEVSPDFLTRTGLRRRLFVGFYIIGVSALIVGFTATSPLTVILLTLLFSVVSFGDAVYFFRSNRASRNTLGGFFVILGIVGFVGVWLTWGLQQIPPWARLLMTALWTIVGQLTFRMLLPDSVQN